MKLTFRDAHSGREVLKVEAIQNEDGFYQVDTSTTTYKTFDFIIECALYGINEGCVFFDSVDDELNKPYVFWALTNF